MKFSAFAASAAALLFCLSAGVANAAPVVPFSDTLLIFKPDGSLLTGFGKNEFQETNCGVPSADPKSVGAPLAGGCLFSLNDIQAGLAPADLSRQDRVTVVYEPDGITVSDLFGIYCFAHDEVSCTSGALAFVSDIEGHAIDIGPLNLNDPFSVTENAGGASGFDATYYLRADLRDAGYTARFTSDADLPEPATLGLVGAGLAGAAAIRRRRNKKKSA